MTDTIKMYSCDEDGVPKERIRGTWAKRDLTTYALWRGAWYAASDHVLEHLALQPRGTMFSVIVDEQPPLLMTPGDLLKIWEKPGGPLPSCPECRGKGRVTLFTSNDPCGCCA